MPPILAMIISLLSAGVGAKGGSLLANKLFGGLAGKAGTGLAGLGAKEGAGTLASRFAGKLPGPLAKQVPVTAPEITQSLLSPTQFAGGTLGGAAGFFGADALFNASGDASEADVATIASFTPMRGLDPVGQGRTMDKIRANAAVREALGQFLDTDQIDEVLQQFAMQQQQGRIV